MNSLVIDTATIRTSCAIFQGDSEIFQAHHDGATEHAEVLPEMVRAGLAVASQIDQVIVGMGPGPFTGLRVGIAFAESFATARSIPWLGVCSLDGIVPPNYRDEYVVATDARRGELYWARYKDGRRVAGPQVSAVSELDQLDIPKFGFSLTEPLFPLPARLLKVSSFDPVSEPLYLRRPDAIPTSERR